MSEHEYQAFDSEWTSVERIETPNPKVDALREELLLDALRVWIWASSGTDAEVPLDFVAIPVMISLGSLVGRQMSIKPKQYDDWRVVPNLWGGIISPQGTKKSSAIGEALSPIYKVDGKAKQQYRVNSSLLCIIYRRKTLFFQ